MGGHTEIHDVVDQIVVVTHYGDGADYKDRVGKGCGASAPGPWPTTLLRYLLSPPIVAQEQPKTSRKPYMSQLPSTRPKTRSIATICAGLRPCLLGSKVVRHSRVDRLD